MREIWKDIKGYESLYQVSNMGRIARIRNGNRRVVAISNDKDGYSILHLTKNNKRKNIRIHRVVAEAFIPNPKNLSQVNHIDEDKANNIVQNLEWCDCAYNNNYGKRNEKAGRVIAEKLSKPIEQISKEGEVLKVWKSMREIRRQLGFDLKGIWLCCKGVTSQSKGFIWRYA